MTPHVHIGAHQLAVTAAEILIVLFFLKTLAYLNKDNAFGQGLGYIVG